MNVELFTSSSIALLRSAVGWQSAIARRLGVEPRTVRRWIAAGQIPDWVEQKFGEMIGAADIAPWPRDEWMMGDTATATGGRREYIFHMQPPRFVARIVEVDPFGAPVSAESPADTVSGVVYESDGLGIVLCEIDWIDAVNPGEVARWLEAAVDQIAEDGLV